MSFLTKFRGCFLKLKYPDKIGLSSYEDEAKDEAEDDSIVNYLTGLKIIGKLVQLMDTARKYLLWTRKFTNGKVSVWKQERKVEGR